MFVRNSVQQYICLSFSVFFFIYFKQTSIAVQIFNAQHIYAPTPPTLHLYSSTWTMSLDLSMFYGPTINLSLKWSSTHPRTRRCHYFPRQL